MDILWIILSILGVIGLLGLLLSYICFRLTFYIPEKVKKNRPEFDIPQGRLYEPYHNSIIEWIKQTRAMPHEEFCITSFDGLKLYGNYYEYAPGAVIEIMFHGYRGTPERDLCGGVQRCFKLGHSALIVDQRCSCRSDGNVITFGVKESRDCLKWTEFAVDHFGKDCRLILTGISMGAATVLIAAGEELPENVIGVLADCGYTSAKEIIKAVMKNQKYPANLLYPFVKLGAKLYGRFDPETYSPIEAMKTCKVPVLFFHGDGDRFVPCYMSQQNYDACTGKKRLVTVPKAGHGLCIMYDPEGYRSAMQEFFGA